MRKDAALLDPKRNINSGSKMSPALLEIIVEIIEWAASFDCEGAPGERCYQQTKAKGGERCIPCKARGIVW